MKKLSIILVIVAILSLALTLTACADKNNDAEVSEVGKKYAVNNYKTTLSLN